jgi:cobalamin biosynthesis Co2+ chelatase CbiK
MPFFFRTPIDKILRLYIGVMLVCAFGIQSASAQTESVTVDSIKAILANDDQDYEAQMRSLQELGIAYVRVNLDSALHYNRVVLRKVAEQAFDEVHVQALNTIGLCYDTQGQFDSAFHYYDES